ncbi:unnamed protein product, partial [Brenthis ino]
MVKTVISKPILSYTEQSCSTSIIHKGTKDNPKKTTQSADHFYCKTPNNEICKSCGDCDQVNRQNSTKGRNMIFKNPHPQKPTSQIKQNKHTNKKYDIHQYYRNENYKSCDSLNDIRKVSLKTILEQPEKVSSSENSIFQVCPDSDEEVTLMDLNKDENIQNIKEFRKNNYFECHSAKSRLYSKGSVTSLSDHKCAYRFYLNDRLFPVPINTDHQNNVRCIECHLPMKNNSEPKGMIQAKVKLNNKLQDMLLMLPVQNSVIIKERRRREIKNDDCIYFGIVKLDLNGDSIFKRTLPEDSLALRYQKGYREHATREKYEYEKIAKDDVIII